MKTTETDIQKVTDELWLMYFNDALFELGIITETERNRMIFKIKAQG